MARTRERAKGRRGGEGERFAYLPECALASPALATAPHAAVRVLALLLVGKSKERNGTMMCSESHAARFGMNSRDTLHRSLALLEERGLIERTRRVLRFRKAATLWAVTWWPVYNREGEPLQTPEPASHRYLQWQNITPMAGVETQESSHRLSDSHTPTVGVESGHHHTDSRRPDPIYHTDSRGHSKSLGLGAQLEQARMAVAVAVARATPGIPADALAKRASCSEAIAHRALQQIDSESRT